MRTGLVIALVLLLLGFAAAPWLARYLAVNPLVPDALRQTPIAYEATVEAARQVTLEAMRQTTSVPNITILGTVSFGRDDGSEGLNSQVPSTKTVQATPTPGQRAIVTNAGALSTPTPIPASPVSVATAWLDGVPADISTPLPGSTATAPSGPPTPAGMIETLDIITADMLTAELQSEAGTDSLSSLSVHFAPATVTATGIVTVLPGIQQQIEASGTFTVENDSLVVNLSTVSVAGRDLTEEYRGPLESRIDSSLYRLLPERYVQSFTLTESELAVASLIKP
jgi:hypothetical protein